MTETPIEAYNYATFVGNDDFLAFRTAMPVGTTAVDFAVTRRNDGVVVQISSYWRDRNVVIEFGSFT